MRFCILLLLLCITAEQACAQLLSGFALDTCHEYKSLETALENKEAVVKLNLSRQKIRQIPESITQFPNLQVLILSRCKLDSLPPFIGELDKLTYLDISRNRIDTLPPEFCKLANLRTFRAGMNELRHLPDSIHHCERLEILDLWSNNIATLPPSVAKLAWLYEVDLRVISMSEREQNAIRALVPKVTVHFSQSCNCD